MDPSQQDSGTSTPNRGDLSASNARASRLILDGKWRLYLQDLLGEAYEKICHNRLEAAANAQALLQSNFAPNPLRQPKISRFPPRIPRVPRVLLPRKVPPQVVVGAAGTGFISLLYQFVKKVAGNMVEVCRHWGKVILMAVIAYAAIKVLLNMRRGVAVLVEVEQIPQRVLLIVSDDTLAHDESRQALVETLDNPRFFAIIPTCVMEGIIYGMESVSVIKSSKAYSTFLVIFDLLRSGKARVENAPVPENLEDVEWGWESSDEDSILLPGYEDRIIDCARNQRNGNPDALAFIITYSREIRTRAVRTGLRCEIPPVILNWSQN